MCVNPREAARMRREYADERDRMATLNASLSSPFPLRCFRRHAFTTVSDCSDRFFNLAALSGLFLVTSSCRVSLPDDFLRFLSGGMFPYSYNPIILSDAKCLYIGVYSCLTDILWKTHMTRTKRTVRNFPSIVNNISIFLQVDTDALRKILYFFQFGR